MKNIHLSRRVDNANRDFEDIIDSLILEIEQLERDVDGLNATIQEMADRIEELEK